MDVALAAQQFALLIWGFGWTKTVVGLIAANVLVGIAESLYHHEFRLAATGDWLATRAIPYLLGAGTLQLVAYTLPQGASEAAGTAAWGFATAAMLGHVLDALQDLGLPIPQWLTDLPALGGPTRTGTVLTDVPKT